MRTKEEIIAGLKNMKAMLMNVNLYERIINAVKDAEYRERAKKTDLAKKLSKDDEEILEEAIKIIEAIK